MPDTLQYTNIWSNPHIQCIECILHSQLLARHWNCTTYEMYPDVSANIQICLSRRCRLM